MGENTKCGMCGSDDMSNWTSRHTRSCSSCGHDPGNDKCTCGCSGMASDSKQASNDRAFQSGWSVVKSDSMRQVDRAGREGFTSPPPKTGECVICRATPAKMTHTKNGSGMMCRPCAKHEGGA